MPPLRGSVSHLPSFPGLTSRAFTFRPCGTGSCKINSRSLDCVGDSAKCPSLLGMTKVWADDVPTGLPVSIVISVTRNLLFHLIHSSGPGPFDRNGFSRGAAAQESPARECRERCPITRPSPARDDTRPTSGKIRLCRPFGAPSLIYHLSRDLRPGLSRFVPAGLGISGVLVRVGREQIRVSGSFGLTTEDTEGPRGTGTVFSKPIVFALAVLVIRSEANVPLTRVAISRKGTQFSEWSVPQSWPGRRLSRLPS